MSWNPVLNLVIEIKNTYYKKFGNYGSYIFEDWLIKLNENKYNNIFECLQFNQSEEILLIRYGLAEMQKGMWEDVDSVYRECRSVVINLKDEELVLTPFRKFFNLNEVAENMVEVVSKSIQEAKNFEVADKLDGSMQSARWYKGRVFMCGSMAISEKSSWRLEDGYSMLNDNYINMIKDNPDLTFIFEYISIKDAHVVIYEKSKEGLHLIGIRNTLTGEQYNYSDVLKMANKYNVSAVSLESITLDEMLTKMKELKSHEKEGWILNIDGHLIKMKCDDYVNIHRILDSVSSVNVIIRAIADNEYDDLISKIPEKYREKTEKIANLIFDHVHNINSQINYHYNLAPKENKKEFMIYVSNNVPDGLAAYVREKYLGRLSSILKSENRNMVSYRRLSDLGLTDKYNSLFDEGDEQVG
ncbi:RNA ligase [Paenibacillus tianjinensis]|uniref:T4 RNA ligase 1-like N-terminal domain-containing protein n=1 Tax=Paenibacillus tianjinensis TaxID=2810347 RepID=A0ABX7L851_9BACL|nr:RNA ligase [Paenibacillus tianjinensis]QSF43441.1 hypothetical protein JRJ22_19450 [Paenibacillus tianjinensis]